VSLFSKAVILTIEQPLVSYGEMARLFLRLSLTAFGGPVAHVAMAEDEIVVRRHWLSRDHYLDLLAAANLIPGPNSTEVMIHVGYTLRGIPGAIVAGACFIVPAFLLTLALGILYVSGQQIPQLAAILWGIKPVVIAVIAVAGYRLVPAALKTRTLWITFALALVAVVLGLPEVIAMLGAGVLYAGYRALRRGGAKGESLTLSLALTPMIGPLFQMAQSAAISAASGAQVGIWEIFFYFLKIGSVLFGTGYVLIVYIQQDLVTSFRWLTSQQLLDAIALGQLTPGPVSTTVAVIGYIVAGIPGAIAATVGIFLPSFILVILTAPLIPKMRQSPVMSDFLAGVNAGVIAAILVTVVDLAQAALRTPDGSGWSLIAMLVAVLSLAALIRFRLNATWLIATGAIVGLAVQIAGR
jgi:chromate transporter